MKKTVSILSFFIVASCSPTKVKDVKQEPLSEVTKIEFLDDGNPIIYIKTDSLQGIIIEDNKTLQTKKATKIELGKKYPLSLTRIEHNYRGSTTYYSIASSKGTVMYHMCWRLIIASNSYRYSEIYSNIITKLKQPSGCFFIL